MADVRKTVEIALQVVGFDASKVKAIATIFENVQKSVTKATESVKSFQAALDTIKPPPTLTSTINTLKQLDKIKVPNLNAIANGFDKIGKMQTPPDLSKFAQELSKLSGIKLPGITALVTGFKKLIELDVNGVVNKIRSLNTALKDLDKRGGISAFKNFANDVSRLQLAFGSAASSMNHMNKAMKDTGTQADRSGLKIRTFADKIRTVLEFRGISEAFQFVKSSILNGVTAIIEYDQALKDLQAITGATTLEVAQMGLKILEVASTTKFSASEVAQGMRTIGQAGFSASEAVETMQAVSDLATGTLSDMSSTVDLVTTAMRVFRIEASQSAEVSDVFANAVNKSKLTIDKLRTAMNYVGPIARDSGVSFKELAAAMGTLANSGLRASTIGTGLRRVFAELIDPSKKLKAAAREAGVALSELDPRTSSLSSVMSNLNLVVDDASVAFDVFGKRGASAVLALSSTESNFEGMLETVGRSGTAAQQAAIQMEGLGVSFKNLQDKIGIFAITLGKAGIADAMRIVINVSRDLIDVLTALVDTALGKFIVSAGLAVAAGYALAAVMGAVSLAMKSTLFQAMATSVVSFTASMGAATTGVGAFLAVLGPIGIGLLALSALLIILREDAQTTSEEFFKLADNFGTLAKSFQDYEIKTASFKEGSKELTDANKALRKSLLETASGYTDISSFAKDAAASINPLTGEIDEGADALKKYNEELDRLQFDNLAKAGNKVNQAIAEQNSLMGRIVNKAIADWNQWKYLFTEDFVGFGKRATEARDFAKEIASGSVNMKELGDYVAKLDHTRLNAQQKQLIRSYEILTEQADKFVKFLVETNKIGLDDTIESIQQVAEDAGLTGTALTAVIEKIKLLKEASSGSFENIIEKWGEDGTTAVTDFIEEYKKLGGVFSDGEEAQIRENAAQRQRLVDRLESLKEIQKAEEKAGISIEQSWKNYYAGERALLKQASDLKKELAENTAAQSIIVLQHEKEALDKQLEEIAVKYKTNAKLRIKHQEEATREYIKKEKKLLEGISIDYSQQEDDYKAYLVERKNLSAKYIADVADEEARGLINADDAAAGRLLIQTQMYQDMLTEAKRFQSMVTEEENKAEYDKRHLIVLKAEEVFYKARAKYINTYNKEVTNSNKKIADAHSDIESETSKNADKLVEITDKRNSDLEKLATDYKDKRISIEKALQDKLKDINEDIQDNRASTSSDILSLEITTEEKIRNIKQRSFTDAQKDADDQRAALLYLAQGRTLLAQAEAEKDKEKLDRGTDLIKMSESLVGGLKDERTAVRLVRDTLASLKDARNIKGELKELDLLKKKNEEIAEAAEKQAREKVFYDTKVQAAIDAIDKIAAKEASRHKEEMSNLDAEIAKYEEKIRIATGRLQSAPTVDTTAEDAKALAAEDQRSANELQNIQAEKNAIKEKYTVAKNEIDKYALSQSELDMGFDEFLKTLPELAKLVGSTLDGISDTPVEIEVDDTEVVETQSLLENIHDTVLDVLAKVLGKDDVEDLQKSIDKLKDKVVTITTKYVTQGQSVTGYKGGGRLPGFGGGDRRQILAEDGEWVINKFAVRKFGDDFMSSINNMTLPKFQNGGKVSVPNSTATKSSSILGSLANFGTISLDTGTARIPAIVQQDVVGQLTTHLNNLKRFAT